MLVAAERPLEVAHEPAAVGDAGERVGQRLPAGEAQRAQVGRVAGGEAPEHRDDAQPGEDHREQVEPREVVGDQQAQAEDGEGHGRQQRAAAHPLVGTHDVGGRPGGVGDEQEARGPAGLPDRAGVPGAEGVGHEVVGVRDAEQREAAAEQHPHPPEAPPPERHRAGDHAEQDRVAEGVGEVRGDLQRLAVGRAEHAAEDRGGAEGGHGQGGDRPVEPQRHAGRGDPPAGHEHQPGVGERVEDEPQRVARRRDRDGVLVPQDRRVEDVPRRPQQRGAADEPPGGPLLRLQRGAGEADERRADEDDVVAPATKEIGHRPGASRERGGRAGEQQHGHAHERQPGST